MDVNFDATLVNTKVTTTTRGGMNTAKLKNFAQKARNILLAGVERKVKYWGFDKKGSVTEEPKAIAGGYMFRGNVFDDATLPNKWKALRAAINYKGIKAVVEEAAYTWFNRMIAIKIMAQNNYDLAQLEYADGTDLLPVMLQRARRGQYDFMNTEEKQRLQAIISDFEKETEAFGVLLIGYCHSHTLLNNVFGGIDDYTELLLPDDILSESGFVHLLNTTDAITEEDYKQVELIGWLYQFYISEKKDEVFAGFKKNKKAEAADIPAATQIFTPNWIVKYMVQNTVGKLWLDLTPESPLKQEMRYLVEAQDQQYGDPIIKEVAELKLLDPAVGSGHILVEGFALLYAMYEEEYYQPREAVESILKHNLFGLDIDKRAAQLSRFAILLKAASKHRDILKSGIMPRIYAMPEPSQFSRQEVLDFLGANGISYEEALTKTLTLMQDAQNLGSIMRFSLKPQEREFIIKRLYEMEQKPFREFSEEAVLPKIRPFIHVLELLTIKYKTVAANPPYMGRKSMNGKLVKYVDTNFPASKSDLMTIFMEISMGVLESKGRLGMINLPSWVFLTSFADLRKDLVSNYFIASFLHQGRGIFGSDFGSVAFCIEKSKSANRLGVYRRLFTKHVNVDSILEKERKFLNKEFGSYLVHQENFSKIPGSPLAYWVSDKIIDLFESSTPLSDLADVKQGLATSDNDKYRRNWYEVNFLKSSLAVEKPKWFPYNSGGEYRKWYGNQYYFINWENNGYEVRNFKNSVVRNPQFYLRESISWSKVTAGGLAFRYFPTGFIFDVAGCSVFAANSNELKLYAAILNSSLREPLIASLSQTVNYEVGQISSTPIINFDNESKEEIINSVNNCIAIAKADWDSREYSWGFQKHPIIAFNSVDLADAYQQLESFNTTNILRLRDEETKINREVLKLYDLEDEIEEGISLNDITIYQDELESSSIRNYEFEGKIAFKMDVILKQLISYAIGCFMGRYRLDKPGLQIAHPSPVAEETAPYIINSPLHGGTKEVTFSIDEDAIVPLMGKYCRFTDDALHRTIQFIEFLWGEEKLTQNLNFLQECLDQDLEQYLVRNFWKDHVRTYKKKPIYWLFASPKGSFQVLVYMHRMNRFTVTKVRDKYLLPHMQYLTQQIITLESQGAGLGRLEARHLDNLRKDLMECEQYDLLLKDKADQQIELDLDNGVTANYEQFKEIVVPIK